jgi:hypothetical protein
MAPTLKQHLPGPVVPTFIVLCKGLISHAGLLLTPGLMCFEWAPHNFVLKGRVFFAPPAFWSISQGGGSHDDSPELPRHHLPLHVPYVTVWSYTCRPVEFGTQLQFQQVFPSLGKILLEISRTAPLEIKLLGPWPRAPDRVLADNPWGTFRNFEVKVVQAVQQTLHRCLLRPAAVNVVPSKLALDPPEFDACELVWLPPGCF